MEDNLETLAQTKEKKQKKSLKWIVVPLAAALISWAISFYISDGVISKIREKRGYKVVGTTIKFTEPDLYPNDPTFGIWAIGEVVEQRTYQAIITTGVALGGAGLGVAGVYAHHRKQRK